MTWLGALELATGTRHHGLRARTTKALCRDVRSVREERDPAEPSTRRYVVVDHENLHQAKAVEPWLDAHPRVTRLWLPTDCPRANPIARACGDVHDGCTRHHRRQRLPALVADGAAHVPLNGPWPYQWSALSSAPAVSAAGEQIAAEDHATVAA